MKGEREKDEKTRARLLLFDMKRAKKYVGLVQQDSGGMAESYSRTMPKAALFIGIDGGMRDMILHEIRGGRAKHLARLARWGQSLDMDCGSKRVRPQDGPTYVPPKGSPDEGRQFQWVTCAGWSASCSGVNNRKTRVADNSPQSIGLYWKQSRHKYKTFLRIAHEHGLSTLAVGRPNVVGSRPTKTKMDKDYDGEVGILDQDIRDGAIDFYQGIPVSAGGPRGDNLNVDYAVRHLAQVDAAFVHLDSLDQAGHANGWGSREQIDAVRSIDRNVGRLLDAAEADTERDWGVFLTADHGGYFYSHGFHDLYDQCIPFFSNKFMHVPAGDAVRQFDMAPTILAFLGLAVPRSMDGVPRVAAAIPHACQALVVAHNIMHGTAHKDMSGFRRALAEKCHVCAPKNVQDLTYEAAKAAPEEANRLLREAARQASGRGAKRFRIQVAEFVAFWS